MKTAIPEFGSAEWFKAFQEAMNVPSFKFKPVSEAYPVDDIYVHPAGNKKSRGLTASEKARVLIAQGYPEKQ